MQRPAQYLAVIELIDELDAARQPADRLVADYFRARRYIGGKDKAFIAGEFYRLLRCRLGLDQRLRSVGLRLEGRSLVLASILRDGLDPAAVFTGERYQPAQISDRERAVMPRLASIADDELPAAARLEVPDWLLPLLEAAHGAEAAVLAASWREEAPLDVRANLLKTDRDALRQALAAAGYQSEPTPRSPWGLRLARRAPLHELAIFKDGWFEVQDEGSQLLAAFTRAAPGERVVDFCAGAGGKTLALAAMMANRGQIMALDVAPAKLEEARKRLKRAGVGNAQVHLIKRELDKWQRSQQGLADLVLVDAPCSGTGTWRRNPDAKFRASPEWLAELVAMQRDILARASRLVKPGGRLVYATCSVLAEENDQQAAWFEAEGRGEVAWTREDDLRLLPHRDRTDGFFAVLWRRG